MSNPEHLAVLKRGVRVWNQWRMDNPDIKPDLQDSDLSNIDLVDANLRSSDLINACLIDADLSNADLSNADLRHANLQYANLASTYFIGADLRSADLRNANLSNANLSDADLSNANLSNVDLSDADLSKGNLRGADLRNANLSDANLSGIQALATSFEAATLTGARIQDWNTNSSTILVDVTCEYIYLAYENFNPIERRPRSGNFKPGEFAALYRKVSDTVDLIFVDGIDWQVFFQSFEELRSQYGDAELSIQALEKKKDGAFVIRLEVPSEADKGAIETHAKELYKSELMLVEQRYWAELQAKDSEIAAYKQQSANLIEITKLLASQSINIGPITVEATAVSDNHSPKYDQRGAQFAGGFAETVHGNQIGGTINNYGANLDDITRLITTLREQIQTFPTEQKEQKDEALDVLDDLEADLQKPEPDTNRMGRRLKRLAAIATTVGALTGSAVTFSGDLKNITGNVLELTETLGIPIQQVQPQQIPPTTP